MDEVPIRSLVVELEPGSCAETTAVLLREGHFVRTVPLTEALDVCEATEHDLILVDFAHEDEAVAAFFDAARQRNPEAAVVAIPGTGEAESVARAMELGADITVARGSGESTILAVVRRAAEKARALHDASRMRRRADEVLSLAQFDGIIGNHTSMQALLKKVAQVASSKATVLIRGESGTGKELIAAAIHQNSKRAAGPFVKLNCAALADSVLESELFGHEKGAFTGALTRRRGRFELADGGTLFLDEITEIPPAVQVKLLRFLQEREFERVGSNETVQVDVRLISATNRDLKTLVEDGAFREDLYYRLNVVRLEVPPLRARPSDILLLADHFLRRTAEENERPVLRFTDEAKGALLAHPWPGNVRELQNCIEQAVVLAENDEVGVADLSLSADPPADRAVDLMVPGVTMAELERYAILKTLEAVGGSASKAAEILGISRRTIQYRLQEWGLTGRSRIGADAED